MNHSEARIIITDAFVTAFNRVPYLHEAQAAQGIAWLESRYGQAWIGAGKGSRNWGCVQKSRPPCDPATSFQFSDTHPNDDGTSTSYSICFKKYATDEEGAFDLIKIAFGTAARPKGALEPAGRGDLYGVSAALRAQKYYEGFGATQAARIANHHKALSAAIRAQCLALGEPMPDGKPTVLGQIGKVIGAALPAAFYSQRTLQRGMRGEDVRGWQMVLNQLGAHLVCDGMFGAATAGATIDFQITHGLAMDCLVGKKTRAAASAALKML